MARVISRQSLSTEVSFSTISVWGKRTIPGVIFAGIVALVATEINIHVPLVSAMLVAIIVGVVVRNLRLVPAVTEPGVAFSGKTLLRVGVVLLGLRLSLQAVLELGWGALGVIVLTVACVYAATVLVGKRMGIPHATTVLTATGAAICGAAAVAGMSAVVKADRPPSPHASEVIDEDDPAYESIDDAAATAIATVTIFGTIALLVLPLLVRWLGLEPIASGVWVGASVHEVGQVVAAGGLISPEVLKLAVVAKLGRVVLLAPLIAVVGVLENRRLARIRRAQGLEHDGARGSSRGAAPLIPWFVLGFVVAVIVRTVGESILPGELFSWGEMVSSFLLTMAMFAMGAAVDVRRIARGGVHALILGTVACLVSGLVSLGGVYLFVS